VVGVSAGVTTGTGVDSSASSSIHPENAATDTITTIAIKPATIFLFILFPLFNIVFLSYLNQERLYKLFDHVK